MTEGDKLTVVVRTDLTPGEQACQAMHAARRFGELHEEIESLWYERSNTLALLCVADEEELRCLLGRANDKGIKTAHFCEPDLNHALTAVALEPSKATKKLCEGLPLALKNR